MGKREAKVCDIGGKKTSTFARYYIRQLPRYKVFGFQLEKIILTPKKIIKRMRYREAGGPTLNPQRLFRGADHRSDGLTLPEARL